MQKNEMEKKNKNEENNPNKISSCKSDTLFKNVVGCEKGKHILKAVLEEILEMKINELVVINNELEQNSIKQQGKMVDCIARVGNMLIDIEINTSNSQAIRDRNLRYLITKYINQFKKGDSYYISKKGILIDLDWNMNYKKLVSKYAMREEDDKEDIYSDKILVYKADMEKFKKSCYTEEEGRKYKYLKMLAIDDKEELLKYSKGDKIMEEYAKETIDMNNDDEFKDILSWEEDQKLVMESALLYARDEGVEANKIEIAKNMLEKDMEVTLISEITGLSIEEIEALK